ncbi:MAG: MFS transporter [Collimonas sp.]
MTTPVLAAGRANPISATQGDDALYRKVSMRILPFLFICYVISFLDRINIGFAQLHMQKDLGFSDAMYGLGAAVFYIGYVLCEVPSNLLLEKFGARKTFSRIMVLWGLASVGMMYVSTPTHFYILRFFLGVFEAGFFPGIVLYLTYWYPVGRRAAVLSIFFAGVAVAGVLGGLISGWIMQGMAGVYGMYGWQWMFAIEGAPAIILAVVAWFYLDDHPKLAKWLSPAEKQTIEDNLLNDPRQLKSQKGHSLTDALRNPLVYLFSFIYFALTCAVLMLVFWMPLIIRDLGVSDVLHISLYSALPNAIGAIGVILIARHSDRKAERRKHFAFCVTGGAIALLMLTLRLDSFVAMMAILSIAAALLYAAMPIFWALATSYLSGMAAAGGIALISSIGITSGIVSPWVIGLIRVHTGNMDYTLYILAVLLVASTVAVMAGTKADKG